MREDRGRISKKRNHNGGIAFTLVELLVVMAIISLLAGMLLPALALARQEARKASCLGNMKQIGLGLHLYCGDNNEWLPIRSGSWSSIYGSTDWSLNVVETWDTHVPIALGLAAKGKYIGAPHPQWNNPLIAQVQVCPDGNCLDKDPPPFFIHRHIPYAYFASLPVGGPAVDTAMKIGQYPFRGNPSHPCQNSRWTVWAACAAHPDWCKPHEGRGSSVVYFDGVARFWSWPGAAMIDGEGMRTYYTTLHWSTGFSYLYDGGDGPYPGWAHMHHGGTALFPSSALK